VGDRVDLVLDPRRGERVAIELPLVLRVPLEESARRLGLGPAVDRSDPIVAKGVAVVDAARRADPPLPLAVLGGVAHRMRCPSSNRAETGLRRTLHDLDLACLHRDIRSARAFLETVHEREGSALRFFATDGDKIFNSLGEGRRFRYHMVTEQRGSEVVLGTVDLLADEFRFCHRFDLREDVLASAGQRGTLSLPLLLLTKLQFIQRIPAEDAGRVPGRVLEPFGRHEVVIGPEAKDVQDILAVLVDHGLGSGADLLDPSAVSARLEADPDLSRTVGLNLRMVGRSPILAALPPSVRSDVASKLVELTTRADRYASKKRRGLLAGPWWEEVDAQPSVDGQVSVEGSTSRT
jgi:hypothetical protein